MSECADNSQNVTWTNSEPLKVTDTKIKGTTESETFVKIPKSRMEKHTHTQTSSSTAESPAEACTSGIFPLQIHLRSIPN